MMFIILSACMINDPQVCKDYRISVDSNYDLTHCVTDAPPHFAEWANEHPGWQIKRWHCSNGSETDL